MTKAELNHVSKMWPWSMNNAIFKYSLIFYVLRTITTNIANRVTVKKTEHETYFEFLPHWGRVTHICVGNLTIIGPDNGLSPGRRQAIIWTNAGILLIGPWGTNFSEILIDIHTFSFKKIHLKMASAKWRPFCLGLNVLTWTAYPPLVTQHGDACIASWGENYRLVTRRHGK